LSHWEELEQEPDCGAENGRNEQEQYTAKPASVIRLVKFRLRWMVKGMLTKLLVWLTEVWQKI
jgi:hypothetical protein